MKAMLLHASREPAGIRTATRASPWNMTMTMTMTMPRTEAGQGIIIAPNLLPQP